jgi:hypothetical protein
VEKLSQLLGKHMTEHYEQTAEKMKEAGQKRP